MADEPSFEWDEDKNRLNQKKHGIAFELAQRAFLDERRVIAEDLNHGGKGEALLLLRLGRGWRDDGALHLARRSHSHFRRRLLAQRKKDL
jgi:hypothetical protein